jgi:hypothetical protein
LVVEVPVRFIRYSGCTGKVDTNVTILKATLARKIAFAGQVTYGKGKPGDMVLVNYHSSALF